MTLTKEDIRPITDPAMIARCAHCGANVEPDDTESICFVCGDKTDGEELCPVHRAEADAILHEPAPDMLLHRWNLEYAAQHGIAPEAVPYHLLNGGGE